MGIIYSLKLTSDDDVQLVRDHPEQSVYLAMGSTFRLPTEAQRPAGFLQRVFGRRPEVIVEDDFPEPVRDWPEPRDDEELFLDKAWEPMNVVFTNGEFTGPWPADFLVDEEKTVYGGGEGERWEFPILAYDSGDVRQIVAWLDSVSRNELAGRIDREMLADWDMEWLADDPAEAESLLNQIEELKAWMRGAADKGRAVVGIVS